MTRYLLQIESKRMGTHFSLEVSCPHEQLERAEKLLLRADQLVKRIENELSEFIADSEISRFNRSEAGVIHELSPVFCAIMKASIRIADQTSYAFDPSFRSRSGTCLRDRVHFDPSRRTLVKLHQDVHLAFGAIGKGFALDEISRLLETEGFGNFRLNAGGSSIILSGNRDWNDPWPLAWGWRRDAEGNLVGQAFQFRGGSSVCIGVSGDIEKGEHIQGAAGQAAGLCSTWVACDSATDADALSTALYALGWEKGFPQVMNPLKETAVAAIARDESPHWNEYFQKAFGSIGINMVVPGDDSERKTAS